MILDAHDIAVDERKDKQMRSHFLLMVLFALITSTVVSLVTKTTREISFYTS